ncbi:MAG TPA: acyl carrier protein [Gemmatimonadales bacterium]|nr:acyl carrier protein [Gemmatimonadales bacterium]
MSGSDEIAGRVRTMLAQVLDVPASRIGPGFTADSTPAWTSLNHLMLMSQLESEFGVVFSNQQIQELTSFDRIVTAIAGHGAGGG